MELQMKNLTSAILGAAIFAGASLSAYAAPASGDGAPGTYYWWNHPKLGMVKVDRATNAMVHSKPTTNVAVQAKELGIPSS